MRSTMMQRRLSLNDRLELAGRHFADELGVALLLRSGFAKWRLPERLVPTP